jgi:SlyX protein
MPTDAAADPRVVDLELRFMRLERFAQELSDTVAAQQRTIDLLTAQVRRLGERSTDAEENPRAEVPPHY